MFLSGEKIEGKRCMSAEGSSVEGSSPQSWTSFPKVKGGGHYFQVSAHLLREGGGGKWYYTGVVIVRNPPSRFPLTICIVHNLKV